MISMLLIFMPEKKAAERGGYGDERYEKLEFQKKVAEHYKVLHDASWKVMNGFSGLKNITKPIFFIFYFVKNTQSSA
ncbi:unnamed protein product [Trifolium pratense]|uniref:Uncharacterized protein n=1 Tax=Trifolium pratense TaxID=57577 RepID=A0ACB0KP84_TRIPR|nr:unnamed protein product [Trifolium pratense]